jgi:GTP cyclohydrolase I
VSDEQEQGRELESLGTSMRATIKRLQKELSESMELRERENDARAELALPVEHAHEAVRFLLRHIGEDPTREGLLDTPRRWVDAMLEMRSGNSVDIAKLLKVTFDSGHYDEIIAVTDIAYTSMCEHHLLPFTGKAAVAYLPSEDAGGYRVVGLSKIPRLVDAFARRLQMQEQLTTQIAEAFDEYVKPRGVAVLLTGEHSCASCRGVRKSGMVMITSILRGAFRNNEATRAEVLRLIGGSK